MVRFDNTPPCRLKGNALATLVRIFVLAAFLVTAVQSSADAATITFSNHTGWTIKGLYITNNNNSWGPNVLGGTLENGLSRTVSYNYHNGRYAVAVVFMNGNWWKWGGNKAQNLNGASRMTIFYEKNSDGSDGFRLQTN